VASAGLRGAVGGYCNPSWKCVGWRWRWYWWWRWYFSMCFGVCVGVVGGCWRGFWRQGRRSCWGGRALLNRPRNSPTHAFAEILSLLALTLRICIICICVVSVYNQYMVYNCVYYCDTRMKLTHAFGGILSLLALTLYSDRVWV
jgi:hypothetical protein